MAAPPPFHLAFPVDDLTAARDFYSRVLGCVEGRSSDQWVDFDLFGHQIVAHLVAATGTLHTNPVDRQDVPVPHFGVVLPWDEFEPFAARLRDAGARFVVEPTIRFAGQPGEQATLFVCDPAGNALEFKAFRDPAALFSA